MDEMKEKNEMNEMRRRDRISYYTGWGLAWGTFAGGMLGILLPEHLLVVLLMGIACGGVIGTLVGKRILGR